jgi:hypothetical protein
MPNSAPTASLMCMQDHSSGSHRTNSPLNVCGMMSQHRCGGGGGASGRDSAGGGGGGRSAYFDLNQYPVSSNQSLMLGYGSSTGAGGGGGGACGDYQCASGGNGGDTLGMAGAGGWSRCTDPTVAAGTGGACSSSLFVFNRVKRPLVYFR